MYYLLILAVFANSAWCQNVSGIKTANLKGANVSLMNNHDPASQLENFELLPGYEVNLFAADPMLANPIHMVWDSRGRLWVACSWAYPQLKPGDRANDKIIILEDSDHDGQADKSTVFADGLYIPTGIELANGGCYIAQSPDIFFYKDTDGDDVADVKELALTGFGIEDSHHSISAWRRGPGGWLYFQEGIFLHTQVETQHGMVHNFNGGVYQYNPRTQELRVFARIGVGNPWGHVFDRWGQSFFVDNPRVSYLSPSTGNSGEKVRLAKLIQTEKQCGGDLASGTHLPPEIRGQLLTGRFKGRNIVRYEFSEDGSGFKANVLKPLIASKHPNFRPVDCKMGPDGAVYVADWYNSIINHAQHDFRDPRRDHSHGRVWRITAKGRPLVKPPKLHGEPVAKLVEHLKSPEAWVRHQTRFELAERDRDEVRATLNHWVTTLDPADPAHDHHLVEAMWACQNVERPSEDILARVIAAKDGHARAAAARVIRYWHSELSDPVAMIAKLADDPFPRARMEAVLSAGFVPKAEAFPAALMALNHPVDAAIEFALPQTTNALESLWRPAVAANTLKFADPKHRAHAEGKAGIGFDKRLPAFMRKREFRAPELVEISDYLLTNGTAAHLHNVVKALSDRRNPKTKAMIVGMLGVLTKAGQARRVALRGKHLQGLNSLLAHKDDAVVAAAAETIGAWKSVSAGKALQALMTANTRSLETRRAAARAIGHLSNTKLTAALRKTAAGDDVQQRYLAIHGLVISDLVEAANLAAKLFESDPGTATPSNLLMAFTQRSGGARALQKALAKTQMHADVIADIAAFHRRTGQLSAGMLRMFQSDGYGKSLHASLLREDRDALIADAVTHGNPQRGETVYRKKALACVGCHAIGPAGPSIGPNLVAVGASATPSYIIEAILEPNASIAEHYENSIISTADDRVYSGVITFRSLKEIALRDSVTGKEVRLSTDAIKNTRTLPSLMPGGLANQLESRQEFLDLVKFVSSLGQVGPYQNDESPAFRKWRLSTSKPADADVGIPAYSMVNGELPASEFALGPQVYASSFLNVHVPGKVTLKLNDASGLRAWLDGREIRDLSATIDLNKGRQIFTFLIDRAARGDKGLRVEPVPSTGSAAKYVPEGGI